MTALEPSSDRLVVTIYGDTAYVHVIGRGSFKISTGLKQFGIAALGNGCRDVVIDMAECTGMDSTFMGVLAGFASRLKQKEDGQIYVVNLADRTRNLLATLGLDQAVKAFMVGFTPPQFQQILAAGFGEQEITGGGESRQSVASTMLEAHESLVKLDPENIPKFKDVISFLREDLCKEESGM